MISMFNNNKSKRYTNPFYIFIFFLFSITISGFILPEKTNYKTIKAGETYDLNNNQLLLQSINKTDEFVYLEIIDKNWLNNIEGYKFKAKTKENVNYKITPEIKVSYKGYYLVKIPLKNNYSSFKLTTIKDTKDIEDISNKEVSIYFNEHQLKVNNDYEELDEKEYITKYLNLLIENTELEIKELEDGILRSQKRIEKNKDEIELIKEQMEFQAKDEIENSESIISSKNNNTIQEEDNISSIEDDIISLKNKILKLESEIHYVQTGEKVEPKLLKTADEIKKEEEEKEERDKKDKEKKDKKDKKKSKKK